MIYINDTKFNCISLTENNYYVVIDFDQTLTAVNSQNSWEAIIHSGYLHPEHVKKHDSLYTKYKPIEENLNLDFETRLSCMQTWYDELIQLFETYSYGKDLFSNCVKHSFFKFRKGATSFLKKLYEKKIPVIIISAGLGETIEEFLKQNSCYYSNIHVASNFITGDRKSSKSNYIFAMNKNTTTLPDSILKQIFSKKYALLFGDVLEDIKMVPENKLDSTLCFGFLDKNIVKRLDVFRATFDVVLTNNTSFTEIENLLSI